METIDTLLRNPLLAFSVPVLIIVIIAFFWVRAGSIYSLLERFWWLVAGSADVSDDQLKKVIQETKDVEKFRFMYGLKVDSLAELHKLLEWLNENSIAIGKAQMAKRWIDAKSRKLITPPKHYLPIRALGMALCAIVLIALAQMATSSSALLQMKDSKTWFWADSGRISGVWLADWALESSQCKGDRTAIKKISGFTEDGLSVLCGALEDQSLGRLVSDTVRQQQIIGSIYGIFIWIGIIMLLMRIVSASTALNISIDMQRKRESRSY